MYHDPPDTWSSCQAQGDPGPSGAALGLRGLQEDQRECPGKPWAPAALAGTGSWHGNRGRKHCPPRRTNLPDTQATAQALSSFQKL